MWGLDQRWYRGGCGDDGGWWSVVEVYYYNYLLTAVVFIQHPTRQYIPAYLRQIMNIKCVSALRFKNVYLTRRAIDE